METPSRRIVIDTDCCRLYREHIEVVPEFYMSSFVRLRGATSDPEWNYVTCEPFCEQIFEGWDNVKMYIDKCLANDIVRANIADKFWRLYVANDYKPIEFCNQGIVQEKINNGFEKELLMLERLQQIQARLSDLPRDVAEFDGKQKEKERDCLKQMLEELEGIPLCVSLNIQLQNDIKALLESYSK